MWSPTNYKTDMTERIRENKDEIKEECQSN
jgi:hypothetical protein